MMRRNLLLQTAILELRFEGKAHKQYEFGNKVGLITTEKPGRKSHHPFYNITIA
jgi:hypothetical protein